MDIWEILKLRIAKPLSEGALEAKTFEGSFTIVAPSCWNLFAKRGILLIENWFLSEVALELSKIERPWQPNLAP